MDNIEKETTSLNVQNEEKKNNNIKIENAENGSQKDFEIQDPSLNVETDEERPGVGIEIFGVSGSH